MYLAFRGRLLSVEISRVVTWIMSLGRFEKWNLTYHRNATRPKGNMNVLSRQLSVTNVVLLRKCQSLQINLFVSLFAFVVCRRLANFNPNSMTYR